MGTQAEPARTITNGQRSIIAAAAPIAFCVLLIDAVVETYVSGSSVRWFLLTVATTALIILVYRLHHSQTQPLNRSRFARPRVLFLVALGLVALTAWLPGGVTGGIRILGQSTSTVLSVVTLGATAAAGADGGAPRYLPKGRSPLTLQRAEPIAETTLRSRAAP